MKFASQQERLEWLKKAANEIFRLEHERKVCIINSEFKKAFELLKGIKFARAAFAKESRLYAKRKK